MKYVKKLFIMTGKGGAKGALVAEHNAFGSFAQLSLTGGGLYSRGHRYLVFISDGVLVFPIAAGEKYGLGTAALSPAHVAVIAVKNGELDVELYGTDGGKKMWESNLCDMVRGRIHEFETSAQNRPQEESADAKTGEERALSLFPLGQSYDDNAIAKVNYYSNIYSSKSAPASRLEELGGGLLDTRLDLPEESTAVSLKNITSTRAEKKEKELKAYRPSTEPAPAVPPDEVAASVATASGDMTDYARFLYGYRDSILGSARAQTSEAKKEFSEKSSDSASSSDAMSKEFYAMSKEFDAMSKGFDTMSKEFYIQNGSAGKESDTENAQESAPRAPKVDTAASERALRASSPKLDFYERNKPELEKLMQDGEHDEELERLLPKSQFVRIRIENSDKYYLVGLIGAPDYICYAVPAFYTPEPPEELDGYCQWLPVKEDNPMGDGYWLIYQDAVTGESLSDAVLPD